MPKSPGQLIDQSTRHAAHLERLKSQNVNELMKLFNDINSQLIALIARNDIQEMTRTQAERQIKAFAKLAKKKYSEDIFTELEKQIEALATYEAGFEIKNLSQGINYNFVMPKTPQLMTAIKSTPLSLGGRFDGSLLGGLADGFNDAQTRLLSNTIRASYASGMTTTDTIKALQTQAFPIGGNDLDAVVRTSLQHAATQTRVKTWQANDDIIKGIQIIATLDGRTSTECRARDGQILPINSTDLPGYHFRCRTTTSAALDSSFDFLSRGETRSARNSSTGKIEKVPAKQTYYTWLRNQPKAFQESVIGVKRTKLLRDGGLSSERFAELQLGKRFEPLTLKEMKNLDPVAFERANIEL